MSGDGADPLAAEVAALRSRVEATEAVLAIHDLKSRYGSLVDARFGPDGVVGDGELAAACRAAAGLFTVDGVWDGGPGLGRAVGRAEIAARLAAPTLDFSRHLFVKPALRVDGDRAAGRWDLLCPCRRPDGTSWWMCGVEDDTYARVDGVWLHETMRLTTVFFAPVGAGWERILA